MNYELHFEECWKQYNIVSMGFLQGLYKVNGAFVDFLNLETNVQKLWIILQYFFIIKCCG
jgi:hypothetical protein